MDRTSDPTVAPIVLFVVELDQTLAAIDLLGLGYFQRRHQSDHLGLGHGSSLGCRYGCVEADREIGRDGRRWEWNSTSRGRAAGRCQRH
jgi:hypothetical protein